MQQNEYSDDVKSVGELDELIERIKTIKEKLGYSNKRLETELELANGYINDIERGKNKNPSKLIMALYNKFRISPNYLLLGEGSEKLPIDISPEETRIPFYDIDVMAHISEFLDFSDETPAGMLVIPGFRDCLACFPVYGESMEPKISNGDVIAVSKATSCEQILWGEIYLVITDAWRVVKTVHPGKTEEYIILRSINPAYAGDTNVNKKDLRALYLVRGVVSRFTM